MKELRFVGDSLKRLRLLPEQVRRRAGYALAQLQHGAVASDTKTLTNVGLGVEEIRLWAEEGTYRVVYIARFVESIYVLHVFQKKTQAMTKRDLDLVRKRYEEVRALRERQ